MLVEAVTVAVQGPLAGGVKVTESPVALFPGEPVEPDKAPQLELTWPPMIQFRVADPLKSFAMEAERLRGEPCAAAVRIVFSPALNTITTALIVNATLTDLELLATDVAASVAWQSAFSNDSVGGV
jgi:hypothetical protein